MQVIPYEVYHKMLYLTRYVDDELGLVAGGLNLNFEVMSSESVLLLL